jgi:hypothetical protein
MTAKKKKTARKHLARAGDTNVSKSKNEAGSGGLAAPASVEPLSICIACAKGPQPEAIR